MSNVRTDIPPAGIASTADVRENFALIKQELEVLQAFMAANSITDSPIFSGLAQFVNAVVSGTLTVNGTFAPLVESYVSSVTPTLSAGGTTSNVSFDSGLGPPKFSKNALGEVTVSGSVTPTFSGNGLGLIVATAGLPAGFYNPNQWITMLMCQLLSNNIVYSMQISPTGQVYICNQQGAGSPIIPLVGVYRPIS